MIAKFLLVAGLASASANAQQLTLLTEQYPPFNMSDGAGKLIGVSTDIVRALMAEAGFAYQIRLMPWKRAVELARTEPEHCVFSLSRTASREPNYRWIGPLVTNEWSLFALSDAEHKAPPASLEALRGARIGSYLGDAIVDYLNDRGYQVDVAPNDDVNPKKLLAGRIDYWATGKLIGQYRLKQQQLTGIEPVLTFHQSDMFLACQNKLASAHVERLNAALTALSKRGTLAHIYAEYGYSR